jgi:hypothetical protein
MVVGREKTQKDRVLVIAAKAAIQSFLILTTPTDVASFTKTVIHYRTYTAPINPWWATLRLLPTLLGDVRLFMYF